MDMCRDTIINTGYVVWGFHGITFIPMEAIVKPVIHKGGHYDIIILKMMIIIIENIMTLIIIKDIVSLITEDIVPLITEDIVTHITVVKL